MKTSYPVRQKKQAAQKKLDNQGMRDLLWPVVLTIAVLPFLVFLSVYRTGLGQYVWYSNNDIAYDFFTVVKSRVWVILCAITAVVLAFYLPLYKEKWKKDRKMFLLGGFAVLAVLSTVFSNAPSLSLVGSVYSNESIFVVLGYGILLYYTYQTIQDERDYKIVSVALFVLMGGMLLIGYCQFFGFDLLDQVWMQKLVMRKEQESLYVGKLTDTFSSAHVYLTLFNPNYAAQYLAMQITFLWCFFLTETEKKRKILFSVFLFLTLPLLYKTYSRMGFLVSFFAVCVSLFLFKIERKKRLWIGVFVGSICFLFLGFDVVNDFTFLSRFSGEKQNQRLTEVVTDESGVQVCYMDKAYQISFDLTEKGKKTVCLEGNGILYLEEKFLGSQDDNGDELSENNQKQNVLVLELDGTKWEFVVENGIYKVVNSFGKTEQMTKVAKMPMGELERFASGRGFIWSRTIPLLADMKIFFVGCGPDVFITVFPQYDYVNKLYYSKDTAMVIDRPHNGYLQLLVQFGVPAFCCLMLFAGLCICKVVIEIRYINNRNDNDCGMGLPLSKRMMIASFCAILVWLITLLTNDSTIVVTPIVSVLWGLMLAGKSETK